MICFSRDKGMGEARSAQKQELEEDRGIKIPVFVQIFEKAALEQKNLDSSGSILSNYTCRTGEIMVSNRLSGKCQIICTYYDGTFGAGRKKLCVRVVDSETVVIAGSVMTQGRDKFEYHCDRTIRALKADFLSVS